MKSILQDWVASLGLRHQGTLLTAIRGCDDAPKDDPSKLFVRCYRSLVLRAHCGDAARARTFIEAVDATVEAQRFQLFRRSCDHYPHHYVMHLFHSVEIVGYKHPNPLVRARWDGYYAILCRALHVNPESERQLDERLDAPEDLFAARDGDWCCDGGVKPPPAGDLHHDHELAQDEPKAVLAGLFCDDPATPEGKYLVKRRDGTVPPWPSFVLGAADPIAAVALRAYAQESARLMADEPQLAARLKLTAAFIAGLMRRADTFDEWRMRNGAGDPGAGRHREDDPATVAEMRKGEAS